MPACCITSATAPRHSLAAKIGDYDAQLCDLRASEGLPEMDWSDLMLQRLANADALKWAGFPLR